MSATVNLMVTVSAETAVAAGAVMVEGEEFASFAIAENLLDLLTNQKDTLDVYDYGPIGEDPERKIKIPKASILNAYEEII